MKATEQAYLFIMMFKVVQGFGSADEILNCDHLITIYSEHPFFCCAVYYAVEMALTFESVDKILTCKHSNIQMLLIVSSSFSV